MNLPDAPPPGTEGQVDTLYLDPAEAFIQATLAARVQLTIACAGLQVCWYIGEIDLPGMPPNCARLPASGMQLALASTVLRWPRAIRFAAGMEDASDRESFRAALAAILDDAQAIRAALAASEIQRLHATFQARRPGEQLRVMGMASRTTTVMQFSMRDWLGGFRRLGHDTRFVIEQDDMSELPLQAIAKEIADFRPHLMLTINHLNNSFLPSGMVNAVWWQDPMEELTAGKALPWRPNDLVYVLTRGLGFAESLHRCGLADSRIRVQSFVVDDELFAPTGPETRQRKLVFVGSNTRPQGEVQQALAIHLEERLAAGDRIHGEEVQAAANQIGLDPQIALAHVFNGAVRRHAIRLACRQQVMPVEVYGRFWEDEPEVMPFFRGEVAHGPALASLYRSASHAMSVHCQLVNHGRLGELAGCGCVPVVFDVRHLADPPLWEGQVRYFNDTETLVAALLDPQPCSVDAIVRYFSHKSFASRILSDAAAWLMV